jgi:hypothetical protein
VIYLLEREVGYGDNEGIAFPSIQGCLAVALQTSGGIFGFHNAGNSGTDRFDARAKKWADWVHAHPNGHDAYVALYGVTFARRNQRGYSGTNPVQTWKAEMKYFANRLGFTGPILGSDLTHAFTTDVSAYVEFRKEGSGYSIYVREWYDDARDGVQKADWVTTNDLAYLDPTPSFASRSKKITDVDRGALTRAYPERLGGM